MNMNPAALMKLMQAKNEFSARHPRFSAFLGHALRDGIDEGTIIEMTVQKPGERKITSNMKVQQSDLELLQAIRETLH